MPGQGASRIAQDCDILRVLRDVFDYIAEATISLCDSSAMQVVNRKGPRFGCNRRFCQWEVLETAGTDERDHSVNQTKPVRYNDMKPFTTVQASKRSPGAGQLQCTRLVHW
jgi:hypothetical protein